MLTQQLPLRSKMANTDHVALIKHVLDAAFGLFGVGALVGILPQIAAACTIVWYIIRFYEYIKEKRNGKAGG